MKEMYLNLMKTSEKIMMKIVIRYILEIDIEYPKDLHNLHSVLPFVSERMKIKKYNKLVCNIHDKENYVVHIRALKQALNHGLILKKYIKYPV